jgi:tetratricopeptide (TPR) repeat protein
MNARGEDKDLFFQGDLHRAYGELDEAIACYLRALAALGQEVDSVPESTAELAMDRCRECAVAYAHLAQAYFDKGDPFPARDAILQSVCRLEMAAKRMPGADDLQSLLTRAHSMLKTIQHELPADIDPSMRPDWASAIALAQEGEEFLGRGRIDYAWARFELAIGSMRELVGVVGTASTPEQAGSGHANLAIALRWASCCLLEKTEKAKALQLLAEARDHYTWAARFAVQENQEFLDEANAVERYRRLLAGNEERTGYLDALVEARPSAAGQATRLFARRMIPTVGAERSAPQEVRDAVVKACGDAFDNAVGKGINPGEPTFEKFLERWGSFVETVGLEMAEHYRFHVHLTRPVRPPSNYQLL